VPAERPNERLTDRIGVLRPLQVRDFRLLWVGLTVSLVGDGMYLVAVAWQVYEDLDASPAAFAAVGVAWTLPLVLFLLVAGALSDRMDRRRLMIAGDLLRLVAIASIGALSITDRLTLPLLVALVFPYGAGTALFGPAYHSIVPMIVPQDLLVEANSVRQIVRPIALTIVGPFLGGLLIQALGTGWAFLADAGTFAVSAIAVWLIRTRAVPAAEHTHAGMLDDIREGMRYVRGERWILFALLAGTVSLLCVWGPWETLVPFVVNEELGGSGLDLAFVFGAGGVGSVVVGILMAQRGGLPRRPTMVMYVGWAVGMGMTAGFGLVTAVWQGMAVAFVAEGSIALLGVIWITLLQRLVPSDLLGRVSSLDWLISLAGAPVSFLIVGPAAGWIGADAVLIGAGVFGAASTVVFMFLPGALDPDRDPRVAEVPAVRP
jgi:DHA3 family tetracycline resistance protein-like MFS transporter